jgi:tRNA A-37 threonylcarbamoyl transferase component Bud32/tetratricopeptide (TPR) repeat protein
MASASPETSSGASRLGRFEILGKIGGGGFGDVFRARDPVLDRVVAIKTLRRREGADTLAESLREARAASALNHPSIVTVHDFGEDADSAFIVMEWVDGETLRSRLERERLNPVAVSTLGKQLASALMRAHDAGIVHRDLKPENVMVRPDGVLKILDFGLARHRRADSVTQQETLTRVVSGTVPYMSPEQLRGEPPDAASDLFALGVLLYEMTTGRHPFAGDDAPFAAANRILYADPAPPSAIVDLPAGWDQLVLQLLQKDRAPRLACREDLLSVLDLAGDARDAQLLARAEQTQTAARVVGRAAELAALDRHWQATHSGKGRLVMVTGQPGAGKTTLVDGLARRLDDEREGLVATGRCSERLGGGEPYLPFLEAMSRLGASRHGALVRSVLRTRAPSWFAHLFPAVSSASGSSQHLLASQSGTDRPAERASERPADELVGGSQERMRRELVDALEELGRSLSICLVLEDLHWSDLATTELVAYLGRRVRDLPLLVVGTYRPSEMLQSAHPLRPILLELHGHGISAELKLGFLAVDDVEAYLAMELASHRLPEGFGAWVHKKTGGTPLFMVDLLRYLIERRAVVEEESGWRLARSVAELDGEIPSTVRSMIDRKLESLDEEQRKLLVTAAVQGDTFDSVTVGEASGIEALRLEDHLEQLDRVHGLVRPLGEIELAGGDLTLRYQFVHVLYQNALYDATSARRRILLHARIGELLQRRAGDREGPTAAELAHHFERGRRTLEAVEAYAAAADAAIAKFAHAQALEYCDRALALVAALPENGDGGQVQRRHRLRLHERRGRILFALGRFEDAVVDLQAMIDEAERLDDAEATVNGLFEQATALFWAKRDEEVDGRIDRIFELAARGPLPGAQAAARTLKALSRIVHGGLPESTELLREAERQAESENLRPVLAQATTLQGMVAFFRSDYEQATSKLQRGMELTRETHDGFSFLMGRFFLGLTQANSGFLAKGLATLEHGLREAEKSHDTFWLGRFPNCRAWIYHEAFAFERALELNREGAVIAQETGFTEPEANAKINVGLAALELGDPELARRSFTEVDRLFRADDWFKWRYRLRLDLGWSSLWLARGDVGAARRSAESCLQNATSAQSKKYLAQSHAQLGRVALAAGDLQVAERELLAACRLAGELSAPLAAWKIQSALADFYGTAGRPDDARTWRVSALQILRFLALHAPEPLREGMLESAHARRLSA